MDWLSFGTALISVALFAIIVTVMVMDRRHPTRGTFVMPHLRKPPEDVPVLFHSKWCGTRYGSPCDCTRCHCPKGPPA